MLKQKFRELEDVAYQYEKVEGFINRMADDESLEDHEMWSVLSYYVSDTGAAFRKIVNQQEDIA